MKELKELYDRIVYDMLTDTDTSLEDLGRTFSKMNFTEFVRNYADMSESEFKEYIFDFFLYLRNQDIPVKDYYIEHYITSELVKRLMCDIKSGKIKGSERFNELYHKDTGKPKRFLIMKMLTMKDFNYFYYKYFLLMNRHDIRMMYRYSSDDKFRSIKNRVDYWFSDEAEAFYTAHYNYDCIVSKCHRQECRSEKYLDYILKRSHTSRLERHYWFRLFEIILGVIFTILINVLYNK